MTKRQATILTALTIIAFILAFLVSRRYWFRLDLTHTKAYTISPVSRNLHAEIPEYVAVTYFLSDRLRTVHPVPGEIEDTLREYAAYSRGKIRVNVRDPVKAGLAEAAEEMGLQPRQIQTVEQDQASLATVYTGIVIEYLDKREVLPWIIATDTLEYDLTSRIRSLVRDSERRIGVIVGDSSREWNNDFGFLGQTLEGAGYKTRLITAGDEIPDNLPAIFVLGGVEGLDEWALYRIDRYVRQGGKVFFAVEGVSVDTSRGLEAKLQEDKGLLAMIASYGVTVKPELALDVSALTLQYQTMLPSGAVQYRIVRYPFWIGVLAEHVNQEHPVGALSQGIDIYWASPLELNPPQQVDAAPLFTSTDSSWSMKEPFYINPDITKFQMERDALDTHGTKTFGAALSGVFPSYFANAAKPAREGSDEELPDMPNQASQSRIIVVGDSDFASNLINVSGARYNLDFLLRAADWLASDDDIIGIRNRQPQTGRLDKIVDLDERAVAMGLAQIFNVGFMPLLVIAAGLVLSWRRRFRSRNASAAPVKENSDDV
ncbi:MAG: GldG family protein [Treponema sp.]|jgi:gliding-associated putative ABC transporter substrate-binding component GldG|nr:GldG family protein [Treponema sp.]